MLTLMRLRLLYPYDNIECSLLQVISVPDCSSIYRVPLLLEDEKLVEFFAARLHLPLPCPRPRKFLLKWRELADRCCHLGLCHV